MVRTIERKFYKEELNQILTKQVEFHSKLQSEDLYNNCIRELYSNNETHQLQLSKRDFVHLFLNDIIFYQRPLRSQKHSIGNCPLESRPLVNKDKTPMQDKNGKQLWKIYKAIPKSNPYYQEFRIWQWMYNLTIYQKENDSNSTTYFFNSTEDWTNLFDFLSKRKEIEQKPLLKYLLEQKGFKGKLLTNEIEKYRWNYVEDKKYPCNETLTMIAGRIEKVENIPANFVTKEIEQQLWHLIYSVTDKTEYEKALKTFAIKYSIDENSFFEAFRKFPPFKSEYGSFSEKAIKKLLPLMRLGKYWNWENIDKKSQDRIRKIVTGEYDEKIKDRVREKAINLTTETDFQGLQLWLAQYIVYDRHSEASDIGKWNSVEDLKTYLNEFKQHSLRNPIVEQVITETLRVVKDIWIKYGNEAKDFFDEIHIELGREMKNTADERKRLTNVVTDNENTNQRIKLLLMELKNDNNIENVREYSPTQQEILKIYEDGILGEYTEQELKSEVLDGLGEDEAKNVYEVSRKAQPTKNELIRYKLWLEQKYRSPYTGQIISLTKLFTTEYQIEHIIPKSRYLDDSLSNKVICEAAVNGLKDNQLGLEFIKNHFGQKVTIEGKKEVSIFTEAEYRDFIEQYYSKNKAKRTKLLLEEIPDKMITRQLNDTRYISKFISQVLSNIVREDKDDDGVSSKNIIPGNGKITTQLKQDWGLNDIWNRLILPRFERMNKLTNSEAFTAKNQEGHTIPAIPFEYSKGFQKKRIDHRHHAMDALVIACATRSHINFLNNQSAKTEDLKNEDKKKIQIEYRNKLKNSLCFKTKPDDKGNYKWIFEKPWNNFTEDAKNELEKIVVSFKQNLRVINKATNTYEKIENGKKVEKKQEGVNWAIRKPMHEETISGLVKLLWVKLDKGEFTTATRKSLDKSFNLDRIEKITDTGIQQILRNYLTQEKFKYTEKGEEKYSSELAFSPEGIEDLNKNIAQYNNGKFHQPIYKVRTYEKGKGRFVLSTKGNKKSKYVQGAPNLFFAVYERTDTKVRIFDTIPLNEVVEHHKFQVSERVLKENRTDIPIKKVLEHNGQELEVNYLFHLSPNDLVYVPTEDEITNNAQIDFGNLTNEQRKRLYNVNDFSSTCYFRPNSIAKAIVPKEVDLRFDEKKNKTTGSFDTKTASIDGMQIKDICIKLKVDRLGNISKA